MVYRTKVHKFSYSEGRRKWSLRADAPHRAAGGLSSGCPEPARSRRLILFVFDRAGGLR
jgi:hypothetical protein